jgi:hypothetical protein
MRPTDNISSLIGKLKLNASADLDNRINNEISKALIEQKKTPPAASQPNIWRLIMKTRITRLGAAAVIIIAVILGLNIIGWPDMAGVAWADVAEKVEQIQTYIHQVTQTLVESKKSSKSIVYCSAECGKKIEVYKDEKIIMYVYVLPEEKTHISIMPEGKKCQKTPLTEEQLLDELQGGDPRIIVKQFLSMNYKKLGKDEIDGIETEVIEVENPEIVSDMYVSCIGRLWVDVETDLPVRIEIDGVAKRGLGQMIMVLDKLQWNVDLNAGDFRPNIPSDYTVIE